MHTGTTKVNRVPGLRGEPTVNGDLTSSQETAQIMKEARSLQRKKTVSARTLSHIIGKMTAVIPAVGPAPMHYRALQRLRYHLLRRTSTSMTVQVLCPRKQS